MDLLLSKRNFRGSIGPKKACDFFFEILMAYVESRGSMLRKLTGLLNLLDTCFCNPSIDVLLKFSSEMLAGPFSELRCDLTEVPCMPNPRICSTSCLGSCSDMNKYRRLGHSFKHLVDGGLTFQYFQRSDSKVFCRFRTGSSMYAL